MRAIHLYLLFFEILIPAVNNYVFILKQDGFYHSKFILLEAEILHKLEIFNIILGLRITFTNMNMYGFVFVRPKKESKSEKDK